MDRLPRLLFALAALSTATLSAGCVSTEGSLLSGFAPGPSEPVCQVKAGWQTSLFSSADPANGGRTTPGLRGTVYFFGTTVGHPLACNGALTVDLFALLPEQKDKAPVHLERWNIDKDTLKRLMVKDVVGTCYSLFLPWGTYRPDITQVKLKVTYVPVNGTPLYHECNPFTLETGDVPVGVTKREWTEVGTPKGMVRLPGPGTPAAAPLKSNAVPIPVLPSLTPASASSPALPPLSTSSAAPSALPNGLTPPPPPGVMVAQPSGARVIYPTPPPGLNNAAAR